MDFPLGLSFGFLTNPGSPLLQISWDTGYLEWIYIFHSDFLDLVNIKNITLSYDIRYLTNKQRFC